MSHSKAALEPDSQPRQPDSGVYILLNLETPCTVVPDSHYTRALAKEDGSNWNAAGTLLANLAFLVQGYILDFLSKRIVGLTEVLC